MSTAKKRLILILTLIAVILAVPAVLLCFTFLAPAQYDSSFYGGMAIKYSRLKNTEGKKVVIIGGSSVAFALKSDLLEKELGMPVVNFGLYANLGTKYMLDVAEGSIGEGDIVIISPEQEKQALSLYFNAEAVWYSADGCFDVLGEVSKDNFGDMAAAFLEFTSGKFAYWRDGVKPYPDGVYNVDAFDAYGDISYSRPYNIMKTGFDAGTPISFDKSVISTEFIDYINSYNDRLVEKGATVYYSFCPMNGGAIEKGSDEDVIKDYYKYVVDSLNMAVIGNPVTHLMDSDWFYDSNFHLNSAGSVYYTALLAQEIKAELGDYSSIGIEIPDKPIKPSDGGIAGEVSEDLAAAAEIFELDGVELVTENGKVVFKGEWVINGLTDYGKTLEEIVIPDTLCGLPVSGIADGCFKGNTTIKKLTFGLNVSSVGLDVFNGCSSLEAIYITSIDPKTYSPAKNVLSGADNCVFYVPEAVYRTKYVTDYYWAEFGTDKMKPY